MAVLTDLQMLQHSAVKPILEEDHIPFFKLARECSSLPTEPQKLKVKAYFVSIGIIFIFKVQINKMSVVQQIRFYMQCLFTSFDFEQRKVIKQYSSCDNLEYWRRKKHFVFFFPLSLLHPGGGGAISLMNFFNDDFTIDDWSYSWEMEKKVAVHQVHESALL